MSKKIPQLNRQQLLVNNRRGIKQEFKYVPETAYKSDAQPSIVTWRGNGKGVQGESTNSQESSSRLTIKRNWKPI